MKKQKFDFFSSPNPRTFNIANIQQRNFHHIQPDEHQFLFSTPAVNHTIHSPVNMQPFLSCSHKRPNRKSSQEFIFQENHIALIEESSQGINQKVDFSEEQDLLVSITPRKDQKVIYEKEDPTTRKEEDMQYNMSVESTFNEVGLKNLALQTFNYISNLSKASYKEVAHALINKTSKKYDGSPHIKKESNIKRRVYDALNVFTAIGLLQKHGKKLRNHPFGMKQPTQNISRKHKEYFKNPNEKAAQLEEELTKLKDKYDKKMSNINRKQQIYKLHQQGFKKLKNLQMRNQQIQNKMPTKIIHFPFFSISIKQQMNPIKKQFNNQNVFMIEQQEETTLRSTFPKGEQIDFIGDVVIINNLPFEEQALEGPQIKMKEQKHRRVK